jgi:hypothetical protein
MGAVGKKMKPIDDEIARTDSEIARLQAIREGLILAKAALNGELEPKVEVKKRSANVKPLILDIMSVAGRTGSTSSQVFSAVRESAPNVSKETVGSVLSRLKSDGALSFDGERYYDTRFSPKAEPRPFEPKVIRMS